MALDQPEAAVAYANAFKEFAGGRELEGWAVDELTAMRAHLGISEELHARLSKELLPKHVAAVPKVVTTVVLEVDEAPLEDFVSGARGILRARVRNSSARVARNVTVRWAVSGASGVDQLEFKLLKPGADEPLSIEMHLTHAGHLEVAFVMKCEDAVGNAAFFRAEPLQLHVPAAAGGPTTVIYSTDLSGSYRPEAVLSGASPEAPQAGASKGLLGRARWVTLRLVAMDRADFVVWDGRSVRAASSQVAALTVGHDGSSDFRDLAEAVRRSPPGSTLTVRPGTYRVALRADRDLTIKADGKVVLEGTGSPCLVIAGGIVSVTGVRFQGAHGENSAHDQVGAAVFIEGGEGLFKDCEFTSSSANGVEVKGPGSKASLVNCRVGQTIRAGVSAWRDAVAYLTDCTFHGCDCGLMADQRAVVNLNRIKFQGCIKFGLYFSSEASGRVERCQVFESEGIGVSVKSHAAPTFTDCVIRDGKNAGVDVREGGEGSFQRCDIFGNAKSNLITAGGGAPRVVDSKIHHSKECGVLSYSEGGGIFERCQLFENGGSGVDVNSKASPTFTDCIIRDCDAAGIIVSDEGTGLFKGCDIFGNAESNLITAGGGAPNVVDSRSHHSKKNGVLSHAEGRGAFERCQIFENEGSGVRVTSKASPTFTDCVIRDGKQAGVYVREGGTGQFERCDLFGNVKSNLVVTNGGAPRVVESKLHHSRECGVFVLSEGGGTFERCQIFENASNGVDVRSKASPTFTDCIIRDGKTAGVCASEGGVGLFQCCDLFGNTHSNVVTASGGAPRMVESKLHHSKESGVRSHSEGNGTFERCEIFENGHGCVVIESKGSPVFNDCVLRDSKQGGVFVGEGGAGLFQRCDIFGNALSNVWTTKGGAPRVVESKIHHSKEYGVTSYEEGGGTFERCQIFENEFSGVDVRSKASPTFNDCVIRDGKTAGIYAAEGGEGLFQRCDLFGNTNYGVPLAEVDTPRDGNPRAGRVEGWS